MPDIKKAINELRFQLNSKEVKEQHYPVQLSASDAEKIIALLKEQETKTGKWILDDEDANSWECSECGGLLIINDGTPNENDWYFCPYCGSKLEEQG